MATILNPAVFIFSKMAPVFPFSSESGFNIVNVLFVVMLAFYFKFCAKVAVFNCTTQNSWPIFLIFLEEGLKKNIVFSPDFHFYRFFFEVKSQQAKILFLHNF